MADTLIAQKKFTLEASRERLWELIGRVIFDVLPGLERMEILDEANWRALLRTRVGLLALNMNLKGEMMDILPPQALKVRLRASGWGGVLNLEQTISIVFSRIDAANTEVNCRASAQGAGPLSRLLILRRARQFAVAVFDGMENRLRCLA